MFRVSMLAVLLGGLLMLSAEGFAGQEAKKDDPKAKKDEPTGKMKGKLPANYKKLGLSDAQVQEIYKIDAKYTAELALLKAKEDELKATRDKDVRAVLTPEQKKRLEEIQTGKEKDKDK
jgi:Spy/CpxP family protein refolding chaperone